MDPASAMLLFVLFQAAEKAIGYAGGKIADSMTKPIWEGLEEKKPNGSAAKATRPNAGRLFPQAFAEAKQPKLETEGRHPEIAKRVVEVLDQFDVTDPSDKDWLNDLSTQLEKASMVSEKPDQFLLVELFSRALSRSKTRCFPCGLERNDLRFHLVISGCPVCPACLSGTDVQARPVGEIAQAALRHAQRYLAQVIDYNENL